MLVLKTENSTYEVNQEARKIRRTNGLAPPTERQGRDNEWKSYIDISDPVVGVSLMIVWGTDKIKLKTTVTSPIVSLSVVPT